MKVLYVWIIVLFFSLPAFSQTQPDLQRLRERNRSLERQLQELRWDKESLRKEVLDYEKCVEGLYYLIVEQRNAYGQAMSSTDDQKHYINKNKSNRYGLYIREKCGHLPSFYTIK
jgi:predicted  nucleic acid-binding Zn-ribbon protein